MPALILAIFLDIASTTLIISLGILVTKIRLLHIIIAIDYTFILPLIFTNFIKTVFYSKIKT